MRVAATADLHVDESSVGVCRALLSELSRRADVLLICGDLTERGLPAQAELLAEELRACAIPVLAVLGNHDHESGQVEAVKAILSRTGVRWLDVQPYEIEGIGFAGAKGFAGGFGEYVLQPWVEDMTKRFVYEAIEEALRLEESLALLHTWRKVVALHYAPVRQTVEGEPPDLIPFLGTSRLAEPIDRFNASLVFHGHAHDGSPRGETAQGVPVYNVALPLLQRVQPEHPFVVVEI